MSDVRDLEPESFYGPWEVRIDSWSELRDKIDALTNRYPDQRLLWRGARNAGWGVESSLFRTLKSALGRIPSEDDMVRSEQRILQLARERWRFDGVNALETFAHLQHLGGPTRLLDVSENPLIAAWFATEDSSAESDVDARLFAFVTPERDVRLNQNWGGRHPRWHAGNGTDALRRKNKWGTGTGRRYRRPPAYTSRISSQSAGFLIDGVPIHSDDHAFGRKRPGWEETWTAEEMRMLGSIPLKLTYEREGTLSATAAPVFTYRIAASAKPEIRKQLEGRYGYNSSSIYSDMFGLAQHLAGHPGDWVQ